MQNLAQRLQRLSPKTRDILRVSIYALCAAGMAVAFHHAIDLLYRYGLARLAKLPFATFAWSSFALVTVSSLISGLLLTLFCREASGSGIPQLKAAYWKDFGVVTWRQVWVKFVAAAIQIGGGSSLGREGPSVQIAGGMGSLLASALGEAKQNRRIGAATGAAAGLAAAFNTPLAAVTFVLEEILGDLNSRMMGRVLLAAMIGALVVHGLMGPNPAFSLPKMGEPTWTAYLLVPLVAAAAGLVGVVFQSWSLRLRRWQRTWRRIPAWLRPVIGGLVMWAAAMLVFSKTGRLGVFSLGYEDMSEGLAGDLTWSVALTLLFAKLIGTVACYGTGGAGGVFTPTLFLGAMTGLAMGSGLQPLLGLKSDGVEMLAVVGMSATLGAVVRAPVTGILIVFEMTHEFSIVPPLMLGALVSTWISRWHKHNFYDALLEQDGHDVERFSPPLDLRRWQRQPAEVLANHKPILVTSLEADSVRSLLETHAYDRFPVVFDGGLKGIVTRHELAAALRETREPHVHEALVCTATTSLREIQMRLVDSPTAMVVVVDGDGQVRGLFTLHDLLRAQQQLADKSAE